MEWAAIAPITIPTANIAPPIWYKNGIGVSNAKYVPDKFNVVPIS